ncbi:MAG: ATP synthase F1 subunit delta [Acidimicrobiales bacterium]
MSSERINGYADALVSVAQAEGMGPIIEDELFRVARAVERSDELQSTLADAHVPAARRQQIIEDLLDGDVSRVTSALVSMVIAANRGGDLSQILDAAVSQGAKTRGQAVAEVRSAVPLDDDQQQRLAQALASATGKNLTIKTVVDESVLGGIVTTIDDEVIDGSVRHRMAKLREAF